MIGNKVESSDANNKSKTQFKPEVEEIKKFISTLSIDKRLWREDIIVIILRFS